MSLSLIKILLYSKSYKGFVYLAQYLLKYLSNFHLIHNENFHDQINF